MNSLGSHPKLERWRRGGKGVGSRKLAAIQFRSYGVGLGAKRSDVLFLYQQQRKFQRRENYSRQWRPTLGCTSTNVLLRFTNKYDAFQIRWMENSWRGEGIFAKRLGYPCLLRLEIFFRVRHWIVRCYFLHCSFWKSLTLMFVYLDY